nr:patatin-like phospholipase family protein [uncultured Gellertiella sp.]
MSRRFILTIDGGGVRGLIPALVLAELERRLEKVGKTEGLHTCFDLMAGSALGAVIAALLIFPYPDGPRRSPNTAQEVAAHIAAYGALTRSTNPSSDPNLARYDAGALEMALIARFGRHTVMTAALTRILIPTYDILNRAPLMISNMQPSTGKFYVWQALRGACAVPTFFTPAMVENLGQARARGTPLIPVISSGQMASDPTLRAYVEACNMGWHRNGDDLVILSLGTGIDKTPIPYFRAESSGTHGPDVAASTTSMESLLSGLDDSSAYQVNALVNGDSTAFNGTATRLTRENRKSLSFFRINGPLKKASYASDDLSPENIAHLTEEAARFIAEHSGILDEMVDRLAGHKVRSSHGVTALTPVSGAAGNLQHV